jgi:outer membrane lipoprotein-sorting protein
VAVFVNQRHAITFILVIALTLTTSCSRREPTVNESPTNSRVVSSTPPFQTREPERYQAIREVRFTPASGGEATVTRTVIAKNGAMRREEDNAGSKRVVYLDLPTGRFLLLPDEKLYAQLDDDANTQVSADPDSDMPAELYLHTGPIQSTYENVGNEPVNGRTTTKYRVAVNSLEGESVNDSETLIWVDESLGMPIKSVTRSATGTRTMELSEVTMEVETGLFEIPSSYQKVDPKSLRQRLR